MMPPTPEVTGRRGLCVPWLHWEGNWAHTEALLTNVYPPVFFNFFSKVFYFAI
jgi:hypothetical protein